MTMPGANKVYNILAAGFMLAASAFAASAARADNVTANMDVTLTILPGCSFGFDTDGKSNPKGLVDFGQVSDLNAGLPPQTATLYMQCSKGSSVNYTITMDQGLHYANGTRNMQRDNATDKIPYKICLPQTGAAGSCSAIWGDGSALGKAYTGTWDQSGNVKNIPFDVVVPPLKGGLPAGVYEDTVQLQITWPAGG